jgi:hypothetical protein
MSATTSDGNRVEWRLPLYALLGALILFSIGPYIFSVVLYLLIVAIVSVLLLNDAIGKRRRQSLLALVVFWVVSAVLVKNYSAIRDECRWLMWSHEYMAKVLAQRDSATGELKHIEWDGWGFPGAGDTTVYLVFDPTDALSAAPRSNRPGTFDGLPCELPLVRRLESHWYAVRFYTDEWWGRRNALDCGSGSASLLKLPHNTAP